MHEPRPSPDWLRESFAFILLHPLERNVTSVSTSETFLMQQCLNGRFSVHTREITKKYLQGQESLIRESAIPGFTPVLTNSRPGP